MIQGLRMKKKVSVLLLAAPQTRRRILRVLLVVVRIIITSISADGRYHSIGHSYMIGYFLRYNYSQSRGIHTGPQASF